MPSIELKVPLFTTVSIELVAYGYPIAGWLRRILLFESKKTSPMSPENSGDTHFGCIVKKLALFDSMAVVAGTQNEVKEIDIAIKISLFLMFLFSYLHSPLGNSGA